MSIQTDSRIPVRSPWIVASIVTLLVHAACSEPDPTPDAGGASRAQAPDSSAPVEQPAATSAGPILGEYACDEGSWNVSAGRMDFQPRGYFVLESGGRYRWLDNGGGGTFQYDEASHRITWATGPLADKQAEYTTYQKNEKTTQVDIHFSEDVEWSCGHNL